jgi:hypothetical protein
MCEPLEEREREREREKVLLLFIILESLDVGKTVQGGFFSNLNINIQSKHGLIRVIQVVAVAIPIPILTHTSKRAT